MAGCFFEFVITSLPLSAGHIELGLNNQNNYNSGIVWTNNEVYTNDFLGPQKIDQKSLGVVTTAESVIVIDRKSDKILYEKNSETPRSIGSITKLMTALVFLDTNPDLDSEAQILPTDVRYGGIQYVLVGDNVKVKDLFSASLVGSDNSSTASLMRLSGLFNDEFIEKMNEKARSLGMKNTVFVDSTGLSSDNRSTAHDLTRLINAAVNVDLIKTTVQKSEVSFVGSSQYQYTIPSTDELLSSVLNSDPYRIIGAKTGYLPEAGYCLGILVQKDSRDDVLIIVLGSESKSARFADAKALALWVYSVYHWE